MKKDINKTVIHPIKLEEMIVSTDIDHKINNSLARVVIEYCLIKQQKSEDSKIVIKDYEKGDHQWYLK